MPLSQGDYYQEQLALVRHEEQSSGGSTFIVEYAAGQGEQAAPDGAEFDPDAKEVPFILQNPDYPNGCESVSAVMLLQSYGIDMTVKEFVDDYLSKDVIFSKDGDRFGPNPRDTYAGDPRSATGGFGIFEPGIRSAIAKALYEKAEDDTDYHVYGSETKAPLSLQASEGLPIVIWATQNYEPVKEMFSWRSYDSHDTYTYPKNSHTIVVVGMDEEYYYVNDPLLDSGNWKIEKKKLEDSFDSMGRQVVRIKRQADIAELPEGGELAY